MLAALRVLHGQLNMSIPTVVTRGYGSFGSIGEVVTRGYLGVAAAPSFDGPNIGTQVSVVNVALLRDFTSRWSNVVSWSASGLPTGLSIDGTTGVITGTPTVINTFVGVVITGYENPGQTGASAASNAFNWQITAAPPTGDDDLTGELTLDLTSTLTY